jgi:DNA replication protein DnaC
MSVERSCQKHGPYQARELTSAILGQPILDGCPDCAEEKRAQNELDRDRAAQKMRIQRLRSLVRASNIPPRFADASISDYQVTCKEQAIVRAGCAVYVDTWPERRNRGGSLVFTGACGTGKTHLACAIANTVMAEHEAEVLFGTVTHLMRGLRATFNARSDRSERQAIEEMIGPDLLIIDEVGAQVGTAHELQTLFELVNERYQALRPTILISNLDAGSLEDYVGQRVMDRLRHHGAVFAFDWPSYRVPAAPSPKKARSHE